MKIRNILTEGILMDFKLKCHDADYEKESAVIIFEKWLDTEIPEPKGVVPIFSYEDAFEDVWSGFEDILSPEEVGCEEIYLCGECEQEALTPPELAEELGITQDNYCPYCGTRVHWEGRDGT